MSNQTLWADLTPEQRKNIVKRYPNDLRREDYIYEISARTGRFLCRHKKPAFGAIRMPLH